jgi:hypothetical protein
MNCQEAIFVKKDAQSNGVQPNKVNDTIFDPEKKLISYALITFIMFPVVITCQHPYL